MHDSYIYFVRDASGSIKIGKTKNVLARISAIRTSHASDLIILGVLKAAPKLEKQLHKRFAEHRIKGEWFTAAPDLLAFIEKEVTPSFQNVLTFVPPRSDGLPLVAQKLQALSEPSAFPHETVRQKINRVANILEWSAARTKTIWYCDHRVRVSIDELAQVDAALTKSSAAPERESLERRISRLEAYVFGMARGPDSAVGE